MISDEIGSIRSNLEEKKATKMRHEDGTNEEKEREQEAIFEMFRCCIMAFANCIWRGHIETQANPTLTSV